ncbi:MAG: DUF6688 family protein [Chitinophagales bacterium]|nr:hypothetical protein [Bacteroidota bacterium]MCB9043254.1 hypothetical protein [Chitinophagales bacterium]
MEAIKLIISIFTPYIVFGTVILFAIVLTEFIIYCFTGKIRALKKFFPLIQIWYVVFLPITFLLYMDLPNVNDCCVDTAVFSPNHRLGIYLLILFFITFYCISFNRNKIISPIIELLINFFLLMGIALNILFCFHFTEIVPIFGFFGNFPIILLLLIELSENQKMLKKHIEKNDITVNGPIGKISLYILSLKPIFKFPIFLIFLIPFITFLTLFLLLFGQKPDSLIRAFTDTYRHGFSQLDYLCANVQCGGHFLCSIGAKGHKNIVKPIRYGIRNEQVIICNRQLLIANAFEDLVQEKFPTTHKFIRRNYNRVGKLTHRYYYLFEVKLISDLVYFLMKPLEIIFIIALYTFDKKPENRIAIQYLDRSDISRLKKHSSFS